MLEQSKAMKSTCLTDIGSGTGRLRFQGTKKRPAKGEELNSLVANAVKSVLTINKRKKAKASSESASEDDQ